MSPACNLCNQKIEKNEKVCVVSYPVKILDCEGGYDIIGDFYNNSKLIHMKCWKEKYKFLDDHNEVVGYIRQIDPRSKFNEIRNFVKKYEKTSTAEIIKRWLTRQTV